MYSGKDIRANFAVCICGQLVIAGSVTVFVVLVFFSLYFWYGEKGCFLPESMHEVTLRGKLAFSGGHQSSF
jgi:hypothetical protein